MQHIWSNLLWDLWCSEEVDGGQGDVPTKRQGLLDGPETWMQAVGGRRMLQRYVGRLVLSFCFVEFGFVSVYDLGTDI